jgi:hypothetical protein
LEATGFNRSLSSCRIDASALPSERKEESKATNLFSEICAILGYFLIDVASVMKICDDVANECVVNFN